MSRKKKQTYILVGPRIVFFTTYYSKGVVWIMWTDVHRAKVPVGALSQAILAQRFTGDEAQRAGIVHEVCPAVEVTDRALSVGARLAGDKPHLRLHRDTLATLKRQLYSEAYTTLSSGLSYSHHKSKL